MPGALAGHISKMATGYLTNAELIEQLQKLNPNAIVTINVKQYNKTYGKQLHIPKAPMSGGAGILG